MYLTLKKPLSDPQMFDEVTDVKDLHDRWAQMYLTYLFHYELLHLCVSPSSKARGVIYIHTRTHTMAYHR